MITDLFKRIDQTLLYPPFLKALIGLLEDAEMMGVSFWCVSGFRTYEEQQKLYCQGRTDPGNVVTNAMAGESAHNFGIAVDVCRDEFIDRPGLQPDWMPDHYEPLRVLAPKHGLMWGGSWAKADRPHIQIPRYSTADQMEPLRALYETHGLPAVFNYLSIGDKFDEPIA